MLARKNKTESEVRQEDRIFIPKMNTKMMDSILRHSTQVRTFKSKDAATFMDLERMTPRHRKGKVDAEALARDKELKENYEMSQTVLQIASNAEQIQELLKNVVINRIEKDMCKFKSMPTLKERQKYLEFLIGEYCSSFDSFRRLFNNPKYDSFVENKLLILVTKESLEEIERQKTKRDSLELIKKELVFKNFEALRNDISSRETMLEAYHSLDKLIEDSKLKLSRLTKEKIEVSLKIKSYQQEIVSFSLP